jgi:hypothetical protein
VSVGSRQTRRRRRARQRRVRLRELSSTGLRGSASTVRNMLITVMRTLNRGVVRHLLYSVAFLACLVGVVTSVLAGEDTLAIIFCLLTLLLCAVIWIGEAA